MSKGQVGHILCLFGLLKIVSKWYSNQGHPVFYILLKLASLSLDDLISSYTLFEAQKVLEVLLETTSSTSSLDLPKLQESLSALIESTQSLQSLLDKVDTMLTKETTLEEERSRLQQKL